MDGYEHRHTYVNQGQEPESSGWGETIIAILVILIILGIIAYFLFRTPGLAPLIPPANGSGGGTTTGYWVFATSTPNSTVTQSVIGNNRTIFSVQSTTVVNITVTAPASPVGQEFMIDNTRSNGTGAYVVMSGPSVSNTSLAFGNMASRIVAGTVGYYIWSSANEVIRVS